MPGNKIHQPETIQFDSTASQPRHGLAVVYDLEGFSRFFNQPDVQDYVPLFINHVSKAVSTTIYGGDAYWIPPDKKQNELAPLKLQPIHEKFLGDGAMYLWLKTDDAPIEQAMVGVLCNRLWNLKSRFSSVVKAAAEDLPVVDIPQRIRFGVARGTIYELTRRDSEGKEYIGFCINLASRAPEILPRFGVYCLGPRGFFRRHVKEGQVYKGGGKSAKRISAGSSDH